MPDEVECEDLPAEQEPLGQQDLEVIQPFGPDLSVFQSDWDYDADDKFGPIVHDLEGGTIREDYQLASGRLLYKNKYVVPSHLRWRVLTAIHNYGHTGVAKLMTMVDRRYIFGILQRELYVMCQKVHLRCLVCQAVKPRAGLKPGTLDYWPIPEDIFSSLCMDFLSLDPVQDVKGDTYDQLLVIVCRLSGYVMALPCRKLGLTAESCADLFMKHCVAIMGLPNEILSDHDHLICSKFFVRLLDLCGVEQHTGIIYRPKGNGRAENAVKMVVNILRRTLAEFPGDWLQALPWALFRFNDLPGVDNMLSPHKIVFGRDPVGLGDLPLLRGLREVPSCDQWFSQLDNLRKSVFKTLTDVHAKFKLSFQKKHPNVQYQPGDRVWVRRRKGEGSKLHTLWHGPCEVLSRHGSTGRYTIQLPKGPEDLHMDSLKPYFPSLNDTKVRLHYYKPAGGLPEDDSYAVEKILEHRLLRGQHQWLVKWKGYDDSANSWEPMSSFLGYLCEDWVRFNRDNHIDLTGRELLGKRGAVAL